MRATLASGRVIKVELLSVDNTYFSYCVVNFARENPKIIARAIDDVHRMWWDPVIHVITPQSFREDPRAPLPRWRCMAVFLSRPVAPQANPEADYSALCVVWYVDRTDGEPLEQLFRGELTDLDWDRHAQNFSI